MKIGWMELLVVAVVALIVIGPDKFPEYAKKFGQVLREIRKVTSELTEEIISKSEDRSIEIMQAEK